VCLGKKILAPGLLPDSPGLLPDSPFPPGLSPGLLGVNARKRSCAPSQDVGFVTPRWAIDIEIYRDIYRYIDI
jgi:hypothetical protein